MLTASLILISVGCSVNKKTVSPNKPAGPKGTHVLTKKESKQLFDDIKEDIDILSKLGEDTSTLSKGFTSQALTNIVNANNKDLAEGKQKIWVYKDNKLTYSFATKKIAAVTWIYVDNSHYIDKNTKKILSAPPNKKQTFNLAAIKKDNRWKIGEIMFPAKK